MSAPSRKSVSTEKAPARSAAAIDDAAGGIPLGGRGGRSVERGEIDEHDGGTAWLAANTTAAAALPATSTSAVPAMPATTAIVARAPSPARNSASGVSRKRSRREHIGPVVAEANTTAETNPAPRPMRSDTAYQQLSRGCAVRDGAMSAPNLVPAYTGAGTYLVGGVGP